MLARLTPHDKPDLRSGSGTERHRRAGLRTLHDGSANLGLGTNGNFTIYGISGLMGVKMLGKHRKNIVGAGLILWGALAPEAPTILGCPYHWSCTTFPREAFPYLPHESPSPISPSRPVTMSLTPTASTSITITPTGYPPGLPDATEG
jgi:hypothetical protein